MQHHGLAVIQCGRVVCVGGNYLWCEWAPPVGLTRFGSGFETRNRGSRGQIGYYRPIIGLRMRRRYENVSLRNSTKRREINASQEMEMIEMSKRYPKE